MRQSRIIDIAFGGVYASTAADTGQVSLFRLLDFSVEAVHVSYYQEKFDHVPSAADVSALSPMILHAPIDARTLLRDDELQLIGQDFLSADDLEGYMVYLEDMGVPEDERAQIGQKLIAFSHRRPLRVRLRAIDETLAIEEP